MRIVSWNIRAGAGRQADAVLAQLTRWNADVICLNEFRGTMPSMNIADGLFQQGYAFQRGCTDPANPQRNSVFVASRQSLKQKTLQRAPRDTPRWIHTAIKVPQVDVISVHVPNRSSGKKYPFLNATLEVASHWRGPPGIIVGDTNSGRIGIDEENPAFNRIEDRWIQSMERTGWLDAYRYLHGNKPVYSWYSPQHRNGFRLDQAFIHKKLLSSLQSMDYQWGTDQDGKRLSDHAAMLIDLRDSIAP